jgi:ubiquinone/menaquinone biosynthesis C-methylase UbiE
VDDIQTFKENQKKIWPSFVTLEHQTTAPAAHLVKYSGVRAGQRVLDVACGTGVATVTAARRGCTMSGLDLTPELLERARENARIAGVKIEWHEGDVEALPFGNAQFDAVMSQFGHMFAPRPEVAISEMLRVLKPGGTIAFSTWPPEMGFGRRFTIMAAYSPAPILAQAAPALWGDPHVVRERLGSAVKDITFDRGELVIPALSPEHSVHHSEQTSPHMIKIVEGLSKSDPAKLAELRQKLVSLAAEFFEDNKVRQHYLITRAVKI